MIGSSSRRRRSALRRRARRYLAAALCAAGFLAGQILSGAEPGSLPAEGTSLKPVAVQAAYEVPLVEAKPLPLPSAGTAPERTSVAAAQPIESETLAPIVPASAVTPPAPRRLPSIVPSSAAAYPTTAAPAAAPSADGRIVNPFVRSGGSGPRRANAAPEPMRPSAASPSLLPPIVPASAMPSRPRGGVQQPATEDPVLNRLPERQPEPISPPRIELDGTPTLRIELGTPAAATESPVSADDQASQETPPARLPQPRAIPLPVAPSSLPPAATDPADPAGNEPESDSATLLPSSQPSYGVNPAAPAPVPVPAGGAPSADSNANKVRPAQFETRNFEIRAFQPQPQPPAPIGPPPPPAARPLPPPDPDVAVLPEGSPFEAIPESGALKLRVRRSLLLRTRVDVYRTAIVDDSVCDIVQFTPREISIIGRSLGQTHVTFWFDDPAMNPVTYLVEVAPDVEQVRKDEEKYKLLEDVINEMFPDSKVYLVIVADKLLVKGQAKDSEQAAQIMSIVRAQVGGRSGVYPGYGPLYGVAEGLATPVLSMAASGGNPGPSYQIINMLRVPGIQQVALKVKIAELNRTAARGFGVDASAAINISDSVEGSQLFLASLLNATASGGPSLIASFSGDDVSIGVRYLQERGVIRLLSEPTLVTLSGRPATFIAGGEFAVPTVVGSVGLNAVTTDFRAFGAIISFLPTVIDKDRIRLQVAPEFSQLNQRLQVNGTPGLNVRAATTTVEMREGQTLAIAGLLEDSYTATNIGDLPFLSQIFGRRDTRRNETELIILVTPELVHAMEPEEVPPLPGFDVTEPTAAQFFLHGHIEGNPTQDYRSTVWPRLRKRYGMGGPTMTSGPFGHGQ